MNLFFSILIACVSLSFCVFIAIFLLFLPQEKLQKIKIILLSLSAGTLIGGAFLHLLPEATEKIESDLVFLTSLGAFVFFFFLEKLLLWRHCHKENCSIHPFGYMNLVGDGIHNFLDGLIIASSFFIDFQLGVITTVAISLHEIPQEIGDFGVLVHSGFTPKKALLINYFISLTVVFGGITGFFLYSVLETLIPYFLAFASGGFIYISASDLIPEIRKQTTIKLSLLPGGFFLFGIGIMYFVKELFH